MVREGYVEKVIYKNEDNGYAVFAVEGEDGEDIFVGNLHGVAEGIYVSAEGDYVEHPTYDLQFKFTSCEIKMPDDVLSIEKYLGSGIIKGVGEALAKRIVKKFRMDSLRIIEEEPERLAEIRGISERKARDIAVSYNEKKEMQDALMFLTGLNIPVNLAVKIYNEYGDEVYDIVRTNPYKIAEDITGVGFRTADEIADRLGIGRDSDFRVRAAIMYALSGANGLGHMYIPQKMLVDKTYSLLMNEYMPYDPELEMSICNQILELSVAGKIIIKELKDDPDSGELPDVSLDDPVADIDMDLLDTESESNVTNAVYAAPNYYMELNSARLLCELNIDFSKAKLKIDKVVETVEKSENMKLADAQRLAIRNAVDHGVAVITGGPGTGKTTIINVLIKIYESFRMKIVLAAPTGRAAKRITEATGYGAQTIHRMLELTGGVEGEETSAYTFMRNESNPLEADVIIIDEMSMVDLNLMHALLSAVIPGTRLILVGDVDQLPSVGPGSVLKDIIRSEKFHVVTLTKIFRQAGESDIVVNAHKINAGEPVTIDNKSRDFFFLKRQDANTIISVVITLIQKKLPRYVQADPNEIQVMTPTRKGLLGVERLNVILQQYLNPSDSQKTEKEINGRLFREGDKVMQIKNNYQLEWEVSTRFGLTVDKGIGVFNGDMGVIDEINEYTETVIVEYDEGRKVKYGYDMTDELELAYAITVHKSQGSEYPAVIIPLLPGPKLLYNRNLLYTAVTRAKKCLTIVGSELTFQEMIENKSEQGRFTSLDERIKEF